MTTTEETELLTRVGPGTLMGDMLRRYWLPALLSERLPAPGCPPQPVRLLGEELVAFRDRSGTLGLLGQHCPHRGTSLVLARNEDCGLRCVYHGWQIDPSGRVLETPNEPERSKLRDTFTHTAYPVREAGGIVWAYMGGGEQPQFPSFDWLSRDPSQVSLVHVRQRCSWLQAMEGTLDSAHTNQLHSDVVRPDPASAAVGGVSRRTEGTFSRPSDDTRPKLRAVDTPYGFRYGAIRTTIREPEKYKYVRTTLFLAPFHIMLPSSAGMGDVQTFVPIDDTETAIYYAHYSYDGPIDDEEWREWLGCRRGIDLDEDDRPIRTRENRWLQDREAMAAGRLFSGVSGIMNQDIAVQESMGPIYDRGREHLGASDVAVLHMRQLLLRSARQCRLGEPPVGLGGDPIPYDEIRPEDRVIPIDTPWEVVGAGGDRSVNA